MEKPKLSQASDDELLMLMSKFKRITTVNKKFQSVIYGDLYLLALFWASDSLLFSWMKNVTVVGTVTI